MSDSPSTTSKRPNAKQRKRNAAQAALYSAGDSFVASKRPVNIANATVISGLSMRSEKVVLPPRPPPPQSLRLGPPIYKESPLPPPTPEPERPPPKTQVRVTVV